MCKAGGQSSSYNYRIRSPPHHTFPPSSLLFSSHRLTDKADGSIRANVRSDQAAKLYTLQELFPGQRVGGSTTFSVYLQAEREIERKIERVNVRWICTRQRMGHCHVDVL